MIIACQGERSCYKIPPSGTSLDTVNLPGLPVLRWCYFWPWHSPWATSPQSTPGLDPTITHREAFQCSCRYRFISSKRHIVVKIDSNSCHMKQEIKWPIECVNGGMNVQWACTIFCASQLLYVGNIWAAHLHTLVITRTITQAPKLPTFTFMHQVPVHSMT